MDKCAAEYEESDVAFIGNKCDCNVFLFVGVLLSNSSDRILFEIFISMGVSYRHI
jgi:hypothetical protein